MTGFLLGRIFVQQTDNETGAQIQATCNFYLSGTTTLANVYADATLMTSLGSSVSSDSHGVMPDIYLDPSITYRVMIYNLVTMNLVRVIDPINSFVAYDLIGAEANQPSSGQIFAQAGAKCQRINDTLDVGGGTANSRRLVGPPYEVTENDWLGDYQNALGGYGGSSVGVAVSQFSALTSEMKDASCGVIGAAQSHYFGSSDQSGFGVQAYALNNNPTLATTVWGFYGEAHRVVDTAGSAYGMELDTRALAVSIVPTPLQQGNLVGLQLASGAGQAAVESTTLYDASAAIQIARNPTRFNVGINFMIDSLTGCDGSSGAAPAIQMGSGHALVWYNIHGSIVSQIRSDVKTAANGSALIFNDSGANFCNEAGTPLLQVNPTVSAANFLFVQPGQTGQPLVLAAAGSDTSVDLQVSPKGSGRIVIPIGNVGNFANDATAATGGVPVGGLYRTGSALMIRAS